MTPTPNDMAAKVNGRPVDTGGPTGTRRIRDRNARRAETAAPAESGLLAGMITAAQLDSMTFAPLVEHVPHLITEGFGILGGPPKVGKSWLTAGLALAVAQGGTALGGIHLEHPRDVLLMALEDGQRRLQSRMQRLNRGQALPARLHILTDITPGTASDTITEWLQLHQDDEHKPLIILDTLGKARPQRRPGEDPYIADYLLGSHIKRTVDAVPGVGLVAVTHTRKMASEDFLEAISGTQGIAGSADYVMVLRRKRKSDEGTLAVTGRDVIENEYAVKVDDGIWELDGMDILDAAATVTTRTEREQNRLGDRSLDAMKFVNSRETTTPAALAEHLKIDGKVAGNMLARLTEGGYIAKSRRGTYAPTGGGESGETGESAGQALPANSPLSLLSPPAEETA
ncbi:AAA family ATPase [Mycolicibacter arupensis]|nr:AAA family ATPase [Mycolicibacter arupensis]